MNTFEELGIRTDILKAISGLGFESPTPIQEQSIPVLLTGEKDFIGLAQTGTGKTAAFGIPLLQHLIRELQGPQALVIAPTRELCVQISRDLAAFSSKMGAVSIVPVYGGASIEGQIRQIRKGVHVVVATPGRLIDLLGRRAVDISKVRYVVLDEADEMLNMGFQEDIDEILSKTPAEKRTWLFSATMPAEVRRIAGNYMNNPFELTIGQKNSGAENIDHIYYVIHGRDRYAALKRIIDFNPGIFAIVFCRTKVETQEVSEHLIRDGYDADALHGDLSQPQRDKVMGRYRQRSLQLLIATDVAARGIDVNDVTHVINYNLPDEIENYTHRSGRTARAGKSGISISFITSREIVHIKQLEKKMSKKFRHEKIPGAVEICERQLIGLIQKVHKVEVDEHGISKYLPGIYEELRDLDKEEIIKRFVSIEFNRFLEYYRNAPDLNVDFSRRDHVKEGDKYRSGKPRLFINLGSVDGLDAGKLSAYISEVTGLDKNSFGRIDVKGVYSFLDVEESLLPRAVASFSNEVYRGRRVRADISDGSKRSPAYGHSTHHSENGSYDRKTKHSGGKDWKSGREGSRRVFRKRK